MPLEDTNNSSSGASVRLQRLACVPGASELSFVLEQARKTTSAVIELPWKTPSSPATFVLKVSLDDGSDDATWVLHKGDTLDAAVLWSFDSDDISLIESLIAAECGAYQGEASETPVLEASGNGGTADALSVAPAVVSAIPTRQLPPPVKLDVDKAAAFRAKIKNGKAGGYPADAFLFFLLNEFEKHRHTGSSLALIVFDLKANYGDGVPKPLPERAMLEAVKRFEQVLRSADILGELDESCLAVLLPGASANNSIECGRAMERSLAQGPLQPGLDVSNVMFAAGAASIPDTCGDPAVLVAAALSALEQSRETRSGMVLFPSS
ncbi:MAG: hypothetical protein AB7W16_20965 [Candidatus Obscuribacterales bacterium]